jgi:phospholipid-binding lipoprotein MlaA
MSVLSRLRSALVMAGLVWAAALGGCAALGPATEAAKSGAGAAAAVAKAPINPADPWERFNRTVFEFNDNIDQKFFVPLARAYKKYVPSLVIQGFDNVLSNVSDVWSAANHALQGKPKEALETGLRFGVNTFFGLGGLLDIASEMGLERRSEDFGQTLGVWGVGPGPYIVLPLLGPSNLRDSMALPLDRATTLSSVATDSFGQAATLSMLETVHTRAALLGASTLLGQVALDRYSFVRDSALARRRSLIYDGNPPPEPEDDEPPADSKSQKPK